MSSLGFSNSLQAIAATVLGGIVLAVVLLVSPMLKLQARRKKQANCCIAKHKNPKDGKAHVEMIAKGGFVDVKSHPLANMILGRRIAGWDTQTKYKCLACEKVVYPCDLSDRETIVHAASHNNDWGV